MTTNTRKKAAKAKGWSSKATVDASNNKNEASYSVSEWPEIDSGVDWEALEDLPIAYWPRKSAVAKGVGYVHQHANSNLNAAQALVELSDGCSGRNGVLSYSIQIAPLLKNDWGSGECGCSNIAVLEPINGCFAPHDKCTKLSEKATMHITFNAVHSSRKHVLSSIAQLQWSFWIRTSSRVRQSLNPHFPMKDSEMLSSCGKHCTAVFFVPSSLLALCQG
ncbi:hypothetical protein FGB62_51g04 [Gracilaria domingensis]|nr:hypothetical protein FGB62_51g04 [Gracilaria domingensis]